MPLLFDPLTSILHPELSLRSIHYYLCHYHPILLRTRRATSSASRLPNNVRIQGEPIFLTGAYENIKPSGTYTHTAIFSATTDIRRRTFFYVQDATGTGFTIVSLNTNGQRNTGR